MAKYKLTELDNGIINTESNQWIPKESANPYYREYLEWLAIGNTPDPADITIRPPNFESFTSQILKIAALRTVLKNAGNALSLELLLCLISKDELELRDTLIAIRSSLNATQQQIFTTRINQLLTETFFTIRV